MTARQRPRIENTNRLSVQGIPSGVQRSSHLCRVAGRDGLVPHSPLQMVPQVFHWIKIWRICRPRHQSNIMSLKPIQGHSRAVRWGVVLLEKTPLVWQIVIQMENVGIRI